MFLCRLSELYGLIINLLTTISISSSVWYALAYPKWTRAMNEEIDSIERNKTWELMDFPKGKECIEVKWVYKTNVDAKG